MNHGYLTATDIRVQEDEGRFVLLIDSDDEDTIIVDIHRIALKFYEEVQRELRPWFLEAEHARQAVAAGVSKADYLGSPQPVTTRPVSVEDAVEAGYALDDPKHPSFLEMVDEWRDGQIDKLRGGS